MSTLKVNQITDLNDAEIYEPNLMTAQSATGTSVTFTDIPSWVKRITVMFSGVSTNGTSNLIVQLGDSGGIEITNYLGAAFIQTGSGATNFTSGFIFEPNTAAAVLLHGNMYITKVDGNLYSETSCVSSSATAVGRWGAGTKTLSDTLTQIRITTVNGTDTFDAGTINVMYE